MELTPPTNGMHEEDGQGERPMKRQRRSTRHATELIELSYPTTREGESYKCELLTVGQRAWPIASASGCRYQDLHRRIEAVLEGPVSGVIRGPHDCFLAFNVELSNGGVPLPVGNNDVAFVFVDVVMDIWETFVDPAQRGKDFGGQLSIHAFELAKERGWRIRPTCTYISHWLTKRPEFCQWLEPASTAVGQASDQRRKELMQWGLPDLGTLCSKHGKPGFGSKAARVERVIRAEFGINGTPITVNGRNYQITVAANAKVN